jgi:hypothetical protein
VRQIKKAELAVGSSFGSSAISFPEDPPLSAPLMHEESILS